MLYILTYYILFTCPPFFFLFLTKIYLQAKNRVLAGEHTVFVTTGKNQTSKDFLQYDSHFLWVVMSVTAADVKDTKITEGKDKNHC